MACVKQELARRLGDRERRPGTAQVKSLPSALGDVEGRAGGPEDGPERGGAGLIETVAACRPPSRSRRRT